jgi:hypothetical protein
MNSKKKRKEKEREREEEEEEESCGVVPVSKRAVAVLCRWRARLGSRGFTI